MKPNGWGLREMITLIAVLGIALLISGLIIQYALNGMGRKKSLLDKSPQIDITRPLPEPVVKPSYAALERKMVEAGKKYVAKFYATGTMPDDTYTVTLKSLQREQFLDVLYDIKSENQICTGYVNFENTGSQMLYIPYLKCGDNFETPGYLRRLDQ